MAAQATKSYYDIMMVGKTGQGKSSTGNKLLQIDTTEQSLIKQFSSALDPWILKTNADLKRFLQADHYSQAEFRRASTTSKCELLANDRSNIRVLDVPGFADSGTMAKILGENLSVFNGNLQIFRWIVRVQIEKNLNVRRVLYFLPCRGALEKTDGVLREEVEVMHHFFGKSIFNNMVLVATYPPKKKFQTLKFDEDEVQESRAVFHSVLMNVTEDKAIGSPPLIFVSLNDDGEEILRNVKSACVIEESVLPLEFRDDVCAKCSVKIRYSTHEEFQSIGVVAKSGDLTPYSASSCHPTFVRKYSGAEKFFGGMLHVGTLGMGLAYEKLTGNHVWPGFTNSDEKCPLCNFSPGSPGCCNVSKSVKSSWVATCKDMDIKVDHTNKVD